MLAFLRLRHTENIEVCNQVDFYLILFRILCKIWHCFSFARFYNFPLSLLAGVMRIASPVPTKTCLQTQSHNNVLIHFAYFKSARGSVLPALEIHPTPFLFKFSIQVKCLVRYIIISYTVSIWNTLAECCSNSRSISFHIVS